MPKNFGEFFLQQTQRFSSQAAFKFCDQGQWQELSYADYRQRVFSLSSFFLQQEPGARIALLGKTSLHWHLTDLAALSIGMTTVPIYPSYPAEEILHFLQHSEVTMIALDSDQWDKIQKHMSQLPKIKLVILLDSKSSLLNAVPLYSLFSSTHHGNLEKTMLAVDTEAVATIIYTSGTTHEPKGAVITHAAFMQTFANIQEHTQGVLSSKEQSLIFLPLSHVLGRIDSYLHLLFGFTAAYARNLETLSEDMTIIKPTVMIGVPRIFEKAYEKIQAKLNQSKGIKKVLFKLCYQWSQQYFKKPTSCTRFLEKLAFKLVFSKIAQVFGGRIKYFVSGGAPLSPEIIHFFQLAHLKIVEGYGLTETLGPIFINSFEKPIPGTVGQPTGDVEIKIASDQEILIRSKGLFSHYLKNPEATAQAFDSDGFFKTGDLGSFEKGLLTISGRKKDIIITSGGKKILPQKIEELFKKSLLITHLIPYGEGEKYLVALVSINQEQAQNYSSVAELEATIQDEIDEANKHLASFETLKKFLILPFELTTESEFMTPSLKVKKQRLFEVLDKSVQQLYQG